MASRRVVAHLDRKFPLDLWMVTRVGVADQEVAASAGTWASGFAPGTVLPWLGSFGLHMSAESAPLVAPRTEDIPRYKAAATGRWKPVRGFTGVPILGADGDLVGTVCGSRLDRMTRR